MTIHIEAHTFETIIGILDFERVTPQKVVVDAKITYAYRENQFINYAEVISMIESQMHNGKYELLETALLELNEKITLKFPKIEQIYLKISKPNIMNNANVALSNSWSKR